MSQMRTIGSLHVEIVAGTERLVVGVNEARKILARFGNDTEHQSRRSQAESAKMASAVAGIGGAFTSLRVVATSAIAGVVAAVGTSRLAQWLHKAADDVAELGRVSRRTGIDIGTLSGLRFVAEQGGQSLDSLTGMVSKLQKNLSEAARTMSGTAYAATRELGVQFTDAGGRVRNVVELLPELGNALAKVKNDADRTRLADALFGKEGAAKFLEQIKAGGEGIRDLSVGLERARRLGVIFTPEQVQRLDDYSSAVDRIKEAAFGLRVRLMTDLAPALTEIADKASSFIAAIPRIASSVAKVINDQISGQLTPEQQAKFTRLIGSMNDLVTVSVKSLFMVAGGAISDGIRGLVVFAPAIVTAGFNSILLQPLADVGEKVLDEVGQLFNSLAQAIEVNARGRVIDQVKALKQLTEQELPPLVDQFAELDENLRLNPRLDGQERFRIEQEWNAVGSRLQRLRDQIATLEASIAEGTKLNAVESASKAGLERLGNYFRGISVLTKMSAEGFDTFTKEVTETKLREAITEAFGDGSDALRQFRAAMLELGPAGQSLLDDLDGLFAISDAMAETSQNADDVAKSIGTIAAITPKARDVMAEFANGSREALARLATETDDFGRLGMDLMGQGVRMLSGELASAIVDNIGNIRDFGRAATEVFGNVTKLITKMVLEFAIARATTGLFQMADSYFSSIPAASTGIGGGIPDVAGPSAPVYAATGVVMPKRRAATGTILNRPTYFPGEGVLAGEAPTGDGEAVLPLLRSGGVLGVHAAGNVMVQVIDQRSKGDAIEVQQERGPTGEQLVRMVVRDEVPKMVGAGALDRHLASQFGLQRKGV